MPQTLEHNNTTLYIMIFQTVDPILYRTMKNYINMS